MYSYASASSVFRGRRPFRYYHTYGKDVTSFYSSANQIRGDVNGTMDNQKILKGPASTTPKILKTIGRQFFDLCDQYPDRIFQVEADTDQKESYIEAKRRAVRLACALKRHDLVRPGDTTMVCSENTIHNIIPILASLFLGANAASIDPMESVEEMAGALSYTTPKIIFSESKSVKMIVKAHEQLLEKTNVKFFVIGDNRDENNGGITTMKDFATPNLEEEEQFQLYPGDPFDTAIYVFTSGTTSLPKPVALSHYGVLHGFKCLVDEMDNVKPHVITHFASLYWISAILLTGVTLTHAGTKVIAPKIPATNLLEIIEKYKITFAFMSNTYTYDITNNLSEVALTSHDTTSLYSIIIGGSAMDPVQLKKLRLALPHTKITVGYGSSECAAVAAFDLRDLKGYQENILASGKVVADVKVKIVEMETRAVLGCNQTGEILVKSPYMMKGYHKSCVQFINSPFDDQGFLKSGDLGFYDEEGYLYVTDRLNDTFKYKTYQVSPLTIERALLTHPAVQDAVAFNVFHEQDRNHAAALITLNPGYKVEENELKDYANGQLSEKNKIRAGVWIVDEIPYKTRTGKVKRVKIREEYSSKQIAI